MDAKIPKGKPLRHVGALKKDEPWHLNFPMASGGGRLSAEDETKKAWERLENDFPLVSDRHNKKLHPAGLGIWSPNGRNSQGGLHMHYVPFAHSEKLSWEWSLCLPDLRNNTSKKRYPNFLFTTKMVQTPKVTKVRLRK